MLGLALRPERLDWARRSLRSRAQGWPCTSINSVSWACRRKRRFPHRPDGRSLAPPNTFFGRWWLSRLLFFKLRHNDSMTVLDTTTLRYKDSRHFAACEYTLISNDWFCWPSWNAKKIRSDSVWGYKVLSISSAKSLRSLSLAVMAKMSTLALKPCFSIGLLIS